MFIDINISETSYSVSIGRDTLYVKPSTALIFTMLNIIIIISRYVICALLYFNSLARSQI